MRRGDGWPFRLRTPLIEPDERVSRIRLSDWFHLRAHAFLLGLEIQLVLKTPDLFRGCQAHRQSPFRPSSALQAHHEVRPLPSTGISGFAGTMGLSDSRLVRRLLRRLPLPEQPAGPLTLLSEPFARATAITPAAESVVSVVSTDPQRPSPVRWRLDAATSLSRPARHSLALRPMRLLPRQIPEFARSFGPAGHPTQPSGLLPRRTDNSSGGSRIRWSAEPWRDVQRTQT